MLDEQAHFRLVIYALHINLRCHEFELVLLVVVLLLLLVVPVTLFDVRHDPYEIGFLLFDSLGHHVEFIKVDWRWQVLSFYS